MARLAGNSSHYQFAILDSNGRPTKHRFELPSITSILRILDKPALAAWHYRQALEGMALLLESEDLRGATKADLDALLKAKKLTPWSKRDQGGARGTSVHEALESLVAGERPEEPKGLLDWWDKHIADAEILASEVPVWSLAWGFAGTLDLIYRKDGVVTLADLKTSKGIYLEHRLQVSAYDLAWSELNPDIPIHRRELVRVDGKRFELHEDSTTPSAFIAVLNAYKAVQSQEKAA